LPLCAGAVTRKSLTEMKTLIFSLALSLAIAVQDLSPKEIDLSECGSKKTCLGSTATDDDPLTADNSCLSDNVSIFLYSQRL